MEHSYIFKRLLKPGQSLSLHTVGGKVLCVISRLYQNGRKVFCFVFYMQLKKEFGGRSIQNALLDLSWNCDLEERHLL